MATSETPRALGPPQRTFIQSARGMLWRAGALTLVGLSPATVVVAAAGDPSPVGHIPTGEFLDTWNRHCGDRQVVEAVLSLLDAGARHVGDSALLLRNPRISADGLCYEAWIAHGSLPTSSGACVLYISPDGPPSTPPSHHRTRPTPSAAHP